MTALHTARFVFLAALLLFVACATLISRGRE